MSEVVYPLTSQVTLGTFNGFGLHLTGFTRVDPSGRCFATRWLTLLYLPILPLGRYYLTTGEIVDDANYGFYSNTTTRYQIAGRARLNLGEILRTYVYSWLIGPPFVLVPIILWLNRADDITDAFGEHTGWGVTVLIVVFLTWLLGSIAVLVLLLQIYRQRWAPLRTVRWSA